MNKSIIISLAAATLFLPLIAASQNCTICKYTPKVVHYDYDVRVSLPKDTTQIQYWHHLFSFAKFTHAYLWERNKTCVRFIDPIAINSEGNRPVKFGASTPILPLSEPSSSTDYIITGFIQQLKVDYQLHIELQSSCNRKTVATSDVTFHSSSDPEYIKQIAEQAASRLSPLADIINNYAIKQRSEDGYTAISGWGSKAISIVPKKYKLGVGEETEIEITLKDCDGTLLANREVDFGAGTIQGFLIKGTSGGTVSPSKVTTDGSGKAKAKFKMGNGRSASINAHYNFHRPSGCDDAMLGSCAIGQTPVEVEVVYERYDQTYTNIDGMMAGLIRSGKEVTLTKQKYHTIFHHYPSNPKSGYLVAEAPEELLSAEEKKIARQNPSTFEFEFGLYNYYHKRPETNFESDVQGLEYKEQMEKDTVENISATSSSSPHASFTFYTGSEFEPMYFGLSMNFRRRGQEEDEYLPGLGSLTVNKNSMGGEISITKITDPKSIYKTEYFITYYNPDLGSVDDLNKLYNGDQLPEKHFTRSEGVFTFTGFEKLTVHILSPY